MNDIRKFPRRIVIVADELVATHQDLVGKPFVGTLELMRWFVVDRLVFLGFHSYRRYIDSN